MVEEDGLLQAALRPSHAMTCMCVHMHEILILRKYDLGDDAEETGGVLEWVRGKKNN